MSRWRADGSAQSATSGEARPRPGSASIQRRVDRLQQLKQVQPILHVTRLVSPRVFCLDWSAACYCPA
jgi:hypothetical protein